MSIPNPFSNSTSAFRVGAVAGATNDEEFATSPHLRRQSTGSFTAGSDSIKALATISEMLRTYNILIEANTNSIKDNILQQDTNFAAMRSAIESVINAINGISERTLNLEETARENSKMLTTINNSVLARNSAMGDNRMEQFQLKVDEQTREIAYLKYCAESSSESMTIIEGRLGNLESRVSNIERLLMKPKKRQHNDVAAKMA